METVLVGEAACIGAAFLWAVSVAVFRPAIERHGARTVNLLKCSLATVLLGATTILAGQVTAMGAVPRWDLFLIALSGIIGLTLGDTALFAAVARIGPYRTLLLQTLAPVFTALLAAVWLGEIMTLSQAAGAVVVLLGVALVITPRKGGGNRAGGGKVPVAGIVLAVLSAIGQGTGVVIAKQGMQDMPFLAASFVRLLAAMAGLLFITALAGGLRRVPAVFRERGTLLQVGGASFMGTYIAMLLMMAGIKFAPAAVAAVLLTTSPVFSMFIDSWSLGEKITVRGVAGTVLAIAGVAVLSI